MELVAKRFADLTGREVYEIAKARTDVFLLEQHIVCQDLDDVDYDALHCFFTEDGRVTAYLRAYYEGADGAVKIGRVLTREHGKGLGRELMEKSVEAIRRELPCRKLVVNAQKQALGFYEKLGFTVTSGEFLEEGVVHLAMEKAL
ncbi:MAG: GNAT family N-acetyltransferase [Clostridia bacterium]|nr:GNAT family N-acetyltransferase [Clostridia bacterium]